MIIQIKVIRNVNESIYEGEFILDNMKIAIFKIEHNELMKLQNANILDDISEGIIAINSSIGKFKKI